MSYLPFTICFVVGKILMLRIISASLSIGIANGSLMLQNIHLDLDHLSVCWSVCQSASAKYIVAKWLIGSRCRLEWLVGLVKGWVYLMGWRSSTGKGSFVGK